MAEVSHVCDSYMSPTGDMLHMCNNLIIEAGNHSDHCPKFLAKFGVAEEVPDGPGQRHHHP